LISLWSWRQHRLGREISFDHFLDKIENKEDDPLVEFWSNLPIYADAGGAVVADRVLDYGSLKSDLGEVAQLLGLPLSVDDLPRHKTGHRTASDTVTGLSEAQIQRVSRLCRAEIELCGWDEPKSQQ
jgi:hypothetical protein